MPVNKLLPVLLLLLPWTVDLYASSFKAEREIRIINPEFSDCYAAGKYVTVTRPVHGDFIVAGQEINISDTVFGDVMAAGANISISAYAGDDVRISGGEITIDNIVEGDLIVFGGVLRLTNRSEIMGDVICYGGKLSLYGKIKGNLIAAGGEIRMVNAIGGNVEVKAGSIYFNSQVAGSLILSGKSIELGEDAGCGGKIRYWSEDENIDFSSVGPAEFDESLAVVDKDINWSLLALLFGIGLIAYWIVFIISAFMILLILEHFLSKYFDEAATTFKENFVMSFGYGMLYFVAAPVLTLLLFIMIVGIPLGIFTASLYILSWLFATTISGLAIAHYFKLKSGQQWTYFQTVGYALLTSVVLKIIFIIPILGSHLIKLVVVAVVYGSFILARTRKSASPRLQSTEGS